MALLPTVARKLTICSTCSRLAAVLITLTLMATHQVFAATGQAKSEGQGRFLVATEQLDGTSFQQAVILITHHSERGATGLAINRPTDIPLKQLFPRIPQLRQRTDPLYLGGPISTNAIFVLLRTEHPQQGMHLIADNIYFATAQNAFRYPLDTHSRTYAGYTGWAAGQLQDEIDRGDWLLIQTQPGIIFDDDPGGLWKRLIKGWSGQWL